MAGYVPTIPVRVDELVREKLQAAADRDRRTLASLVRNILTDAVDERLPAGADAGGSR
jgi:hypothetical protein